MYDVDTQFHGPEMKVYLNFVIKQFLVKVIEDVKWISVQSFMTQCRERRDSLMN